MSQNWNNRLVYRAVFHPQALAAIQSYPKLVQKALGKAILDLQRGNSLKMPLARPMPDIAAGAHELRIKDETGAYWVFYVIRLSLGVVIFHAFRKQTQKTPPREITLAKKRLREMM